MHGGGAGFEALEARDARFFFLVVGGEDLGVRAGFFLRLAVEQVDGKSFLIMKRNHVSSTRCVFKLFDCGCTGELGCFLQLAVAGDFEAAAEKLLRPLRGVVDVLVIAVALEPTRCVGFVGHGHAEVAQKDSDLVQVGVLVAHVHQFGQFDLCITVDALLVLPLAERFAWFGDCFALGD